jgi:hypothetical protein
MRRITAALATAALAVLALAGCSTQPNTHPPSESPTSSAPGDAKVAAGWLDDGRMIGVVTWGSSTCVPVGGEASVSGDAIDIPFSSAADQTACTADYAPRVTLVMTPAGVDPSKDYDIRVTGADVAGAGSLDGVEGLGGPSAPASEGPSAGWTDEDGLFVMATYGSGCKPQVESAVASGAAEVTVTFAKPPAGQVCTQQYGPRGSVAQVSDLQKSENVSAVLNGDGLDDVRVPIVGEN